MFNDDALKKGKENYGTIQNFDKTFADWHNNVLMPALKKYASGEYDSMMISSDRNKIKVYTKMYKGALFKGIKEALISAGCTNLVFQQENNYRSSITAKPPELK